MKLLKILKRKRQRRKAIRLLRGDETITVNIYCSDFDNLNGEVLALHISKEVNNYFNLLKQRYGITDDEI